MEAKDFCSKELYIEMKKISAPALVSIEHCVKPEHLRLALAGKTRASTLKRYIKVWRQWRTWAASLKGEQAHYASGDLVEYLFSRYDEPCGRYLHLLSKRLHGWSG